MMNLVWSSITQHKTFRPKPLSSHNYIVLTCVHLKCSITCHKHLLSSRKFICDNVVNDVICLSTGISNVLEFLWCMSAFEFYVYLIAVNLPNRIIPRPLHILITKSWTCRIYMFIHCCKTINWDDRNGGKQTSEQKIIHTDPISHTSRRIGDTSIYYLILYVIWIFAYMSILGRNYLFIAWSYT